MIYLVEGLYGRLVAGTYERRVGVGPFPERVSVGVLSAVFTPELVDEVIERAGAREERSRALPARLMVYFVLALWLFTGRNCGYRVVLSKLVDGLRWRGLGWDGWQVPADSSLARARVRLGADPLRLLFARVAGPVGADEAEGVWWRGHRVCSLDGSTVDVPDTGENQELGRPGNGRKDGAFPQVRFVALAESATGALLGATWGPLALGEQALTARLLPGFGAGMLVLADRNFPSYALWRDAAAGGAQLLWRVSASFKLPVLGVLPDGTYLSELKPARRRDGAPLTVRVIEYSVQTVEADGSATTSELFCLITTLLDPAGAPAAELAGLYPSRWRSETVIGYIKTDLAEGQPVLRSKDPAGVDQEMWSLFCVYQGLCRLLGGVAEQCKLPPGKISFRRTMAAATDSIAAAFPP